MTGTVAEFRASTRLVIIERIGSEAEEMCPGVDARVRRRRRRRDRAGRVGGLLAL